MGQAQRLVTSIDVRGSDPGMSISALLELELTDGRRVTLLDDRGWISSGGSDAWAYWSLQDLVDGARTVVGHDEPPEGVSHEEEAAKHWNHLAACAGVHGVDVTGPDLAALTHNVDISEAIRSRVARSAR